MKSSSWLIEENGDNYPKYSKYIYTVVMTTQPFSFML